MSNFKIRSSSFAFNVELVGFFGARVLAPAPTFLVVALDGGRETTSLLVVFCFCTGTRGFIGLTCDVVALERNCFLGEIAFAVALDLTGRAVTVGFVMAVGREVEVVRVAVVLAVVVAVLTAVVDRVGRVVEVDSTVPRVLAETGF